MPRTIPARVPPSQTEGYIRFLVDVPSEGIATLSTALGKQKATLPAGALIDGVTVYLETAINGTTPQFQVGIPGTLTALVADATVTEATPGIYRTADAALATGGFGVPTTAELAVMAKITATDATTGRAHVVIKYVMA